MFINVSEILLTREELLKQQNMKTLTMCTIVGKPTDEFKEVFEQQGNFYELLVHKYNLHELEFMIEDFYSTELMVRPVNVCLLKEEDGTECADFCSISLFMCFDYSTDTINGILSSMFEEVYYCCPEVLTDLQAVELMRYEDVTIMPLLSHVKFQ